MTILSKTAIIRKPGYMYYVKDGYVWAAPLKGNKTGNKHRANEEHIPASMNKMCWVNKEGYVETK